MPRSQVVIMVVVAKVVAVLHKVEAVVLNQVVVAPVKHQQS